MKVIKMSSTHQYVSTNEYNLIGDFSKPRYIKLNHDYELDYILELFSTSLYTLEEIIDKCNLKNLNEEKVRRIIKSLLNIGILEIRDYPDSLSLDDYRNYKIPETYFNERFGQEISWLKKFETSEIDRFAIFKKLQNLKITIIGIGGLGSYIAVLLSAMGVKNIKLVDADTVNISNFTRQIFFTVNDFAKSIPKVKSLERYINLFNPEVNVQSVCRYLNTKLDAEQIIDDDTDIVIQTADKPKGFLERIINEICIKKNISYIFSHGGNIGPFYVPGISKTCYLCLEKLLNEESSNLYDAFIKNFDNNMETVTDSFVLGPLRGAFYIISEIIRYVVDKNSITIIDKLLMMGDGYKSIEYMEIPEYSKCICKKS